MTKSFLNTVAADDELKKPSELVKKDIVNIYKIF